MLADIGIKDKRAYVRIIDQVFLRFRAIDSEEYAKIEQQLRRHGMDVQWPPAKAFSASDKIDLYIQRMRERDDILANIFEALDQKLNHILDILTMRMNSMPDEPYTVELSAAGMAFNHQSPMSPGQVLEIDLGLLPERSFLRCYGKVVRCEEDGHGGFMIAIEFIYINNVDQDRLIEHVFKKQMLQLQLSRQQRDKDNL